MQATNLLDVDSFIMTSLFQALRQWGRRESKRYAKTGVGGGGGGRRKKEGFRFALSQSPRTRLSRHLELDILCHDHKSSHYQA